MRVYVTNGPRNGLKIGGRVGPCPALEAGGGGCWVVFMPFLEPLMPQTHTVPGFRLGPGLRVNPTSFLYKVSCSQLRALNPFLLSVQVGLVVFCQAG